MAKTTVLLDLEDMSDEVLDDIQEAPDYIDPPAGDYKVRTVSGKISKFENDEGEIIQSIQVTLAVEKTLELVSDEEPPVPDGSLFIMRFQGTTDGIAIFKREIKKMADLESTKGMTISSAFELMESGLVFSARISYSKFKGRDGVVRNNLRVKIVPTVLTEDEDTESLF